MGRWILTQKVHGWRPHHPNHGASAPPADRVKRVSFGIQAILRCPFALSSAEAGETAWVIFGEETCFATIQDYFDQGI